VQNTGKTAHSYRVLSPVESGNLLLFPVVETNNNGSASNPFITLDEGFKSGEVEVTEAGHARGLVRSRNGGVSASGRGDAVNTLVLINNSSKPLLLLAGEIVTGGKQDRVIAKDRIVPAGAEPVDLSVFCIEHGRWTESSAKFGATAAAPAKSFMVQPRVREQAMVARDQQQVWNSVGGVVSQMAGVAAAPPSSANSTVSVESSYSAIDVIPAHSRNLSLGTTSYAKAMQNSAVSAKVDEASAPLMKSRDSILATLRQEHAVGVIVAVHGEIVWADLFSDTDLLTRYWNKLVRSYAAESLTPVELESSSKASVADAQRFLDGPQQGTETSEGEVGVYRYREVKVDGTDTFALETLLGGADYDVHISKLRLQGQQASGRGAHWIR
jgi:hypothetical protein